MTYKDDAKAAILALKERGGSSLPAIKKQLKLDASKFRHLNLALKKGVESGFFKKNKGKYMLSAEAKKAPKKKAAPKKKKAAKKKKPAKKKKAAKKKKPAKKKKAAKKKKTTKKKPAKKAKKSAGKKKKGSKKK